MASASFIAPFPSQPAQPGTTPEAFQSRHGQITNISQPFQTHTGFQTAPGVSDNKQEHIQQDIVMQQDSQNQGETDNPTAAAAYLKKHTLLAEAAKRAEMAVLMRDFEGVAL
ncbi:MAG: hypothetical protein M1834_002179 [Cirrosporium novae-zelandiae]|nr:MAG: hypothetical protein M1834_002179 [Cirrosporium novae-zelandiae]